ncbi:MAG: alpha/beta fold hydrolase [Nitrospirae bacterium]|nr:alpha/beta fold hydrolase [Nitrospirota bacterium]
MRKGPALGYEPSHAVGKAHATKVDGNSIAWAETGRGKPLLLIHGVMDSHRTWRRLAPLLARRFRVLMPDLPGHGYSGRPDAPYTLAWYSKTLSAWMEAIGVRRAHVCGHSFGGGIAQWMLLEDRRRVDRLALVSSGGLGREVSFGLRVSSFPGLGPLLTPLVLRLGLPLAQRITPGAFGHNEPDEIERLVRMCRIPGSDRAFNRTVTGVINILGQHVQSFSRAGEIKSLPPMALFWGDKDPILPISHAHAACRRLEHSTLSVYPGVGHYPHLDEPNRLAAELGTFLTDPKRRCARLRMGDFR